MEASRRVDKPWGFEIWWAVTDKYVGKLLHVEGGHRLSLQYHEHKDESCLVLSGRARLVKGAALGDLQTVPVQAGSTWRNRPGEIHTVEALETTEIVEASTPELDDVVRLLDDYGRPSRAAVEEVVARRGNQPAVAAPVRLVDRDLVSAALSLRRDRVAELLNDPTFPPPVAYFRGRTLWEEAAVRAWHDALHSTVHECALASQE